MFKRFSALECPVVGCGRRRVQRRGASSNGELIEKLEKAVGKGTTEHGLDDIIA